MGGCSFSVVVEGWSAESAFDEAVKSAQYEYGHGGYTGTIAEKSGFRLLHPPNLDRESPAFREWYERQSDANDKWGPAFCVVLAEPGKIGSLSKAQASVQAKKLFGPTAEVSYKGGRAEVRGESDKQAWGVNERLPSGKWRVTFAQAEGETAAEAYGKLFAQKGRYLFFGIASS